MSDYEKLLNDYKELDKAFAYEHKELLKERAKTKELQEQIKRAKHLLACYKVRYRELAYLMSVMLEVKKNEVIY